MEFGVDDRKVEKPRSKVMPREASAGDLSNAGGSVVVVSEWCGVVSEWLVSG